MKFFLLSENKTGRLVIDANGKLQGCTVQNITTASCWIDAKRKFGFELTPLQQVLLDEKNNRLKAGRRTVRHVEDAGKKLRVADSTLPDWIKAGFEEGNDL